MAYLQAIQAMNPIKRDGKDKPKQKPPPDNEVHIKRSANPLNEFIENRRAIVGAFGSLFPLGIGPGRDGSLSIVDARHLLLQFHNSFADCPQLVISYSIKNKDIV